MEVPCSEELFQVSARARLSDDGAAAPASFIHYSLPSWKSFALILFIWRRLWQAFLVSTRRQSILCDGLNLGWSPPANLLDLVRKIRLYSDRSGFGLVNTSDAKPISPLVFIGFEFLKINKRKFVNSTVSPWLYTNTVRRYSISRS